MNEELKNKWVEALRSGEHKQCYNNWFEEDKCCVIGLLYKIVYNSNETTKEQLQTIENMLPYGTFSVLTFKNDLDELTFDQLADYIDQNL